MAETSAKSITCENSVWAAVQSVCEKENRSLSNAVETLLKEAVKAREKK